MNTQLLFDFPAVSNPSLPEKIGHQTVNIPQVKKSPLTKELLQSFAELGILEVCDFDIDETFALNIEVKLWNEYVETHYNKLLYQEWPSDEEIDQKHEELDEIWHNAYIRIASALEELQQQSNIAYAPKEYVGELWNIYARESSLHHERPLDYRTFTGCFTNWINNLSDKF